VIMSGRLGEWTVEDLLQIARITQKTTSIEMIGEGCSGVIYLRDGAVVHAELHGDQPPPGDRFSQVVEVIVTLASIVEGTFEFGNLQVPYSDDQPIDVKSVFAAMEKDHAREKRLAQLGVSSTEGLGLSRNVGDVLTLKPAAWQLIADLVEPFTIASLEKRIGRRKAVAIVLTLEAVGLLVRNVAVPLATGRRTTAQSRSAEVGVTPALPKPVVERHSAGGWEVEASDGAGEPIVEIFGQPPVPRPMHEVVTPSETTLVSDVLGDLRSRFRSGGGQFYSPDDEDD
jgi:hypothetical protein